MEVENVGVSCIEVDKILEPQFDLKDLLIYDSNELTGKSNEYLKDLARDNAQLLINQIFKRAGLETEIVNDSVVTELPEKKYDDVFVQPREKPIPKKSAQTKWEAFATLKGINAKKKKSRMVWCEITNSWKPRWGYMRAEKASQLNKNGESKDWIRVIKPHEDPNVDPWEKEKTEKKERVAKNEHARLKNVARQKGMNNAKRQQDKNELRDSFRKAKFSTASLGNFDEAVAGEKKEKIGGKKKYNALFSKDADNESKQILDLMSAKNPKFNKNAAADKVLNFEKKKAAGKVQKRNSHLKADGKSRKGKPTGNKVANRRQR